MKKTFLALFAGMLFGFCAQAVAAAPSLDGKIFTGEVQMQGAEKPDVDNFIFDKGTFRSTACDQYGYTAAPYTVSETGKTTTFKSQTKNDKGATIAWNGTVDGNSIHGTAVMTDAEGKTTNMTFKGSME